MNKDQLIYLAKISDKSGELVHLNPYIAWQPGDSYVRLDGDFHIEHLEAIVWFVRGGPNKLGGGPSSIPPLTAEEIAAIHSEFQAPKPSREKQIETFKGLPTRVINALYAEGVYTTAQLKHYYSIDKSTLRRRLVFVPGLGAKGIKQIHDWLRERGQLPTGEVHL